MHELRPLEPADADRAGLGLEWAGVSGNDVHLAGLWDGPRLVGAARIAPVRRTRRAHAAAVQIAVFDPSAAEPLFARIVDFADQWTTLDRLELDLRQDDPAIAAAVAHGFEAEVHRVGRCADGVDEIAFGRLRPGFVPRPVGPTPVRPAAGRRAPSEVGFRTLTADDSAELRDLSIDLTAVWGTFQTPWSNERYYAARHTDTPPEHLVLGILADGALAGIGSIRPMGYPGVYGLGMGISVHWQGCGLGGRLLDEVIARGRARSVRRIELGVWEDNVRGVALYRSRGFVLEGKVRCDGIRGGGHATSLEMALSVTNG